LKDAILSEWIELLQVHFQILHGNSIVQNDAEVALILTSDNRVLKINVLAVAFSVIKEAAVLEWAGVDTIEEDHSQFEATILDDADPNVKAIIDHAVADLKYKDVLYGPITDCVEASVREYISSILTAAASLAKGIKLSAERSITGSRATGKLDYAMQYRQFYIVIAEGKKDSLKLGVDQNVAQMLASRENYLCDREHRKRNFMEFAGPIAQVPSTGIVSTGKEWLLMRYTLLPTPLLVKSKVLSLPIIKIAGLESDVELRKDVLAVVSLIVGALNLQKDAVDLNEYTKKPRV
jgi:hypothetical protein